MSTLRRTTQQILEALRAGKLDHNDCRCEERAVLEKFDMTTGTPVLVETVTVVSKDGAVPDVTVRKH